MKKTLLATALLAVTLSPVAAEAQDHRRDNDRREWNERDQRGDHRESGNRDRRTDHREGWQRWRDSHRDTYRRGNWRAPFHYRSFGIGGILPRSYWGPRYYVDNWNSYRLPAPGYRLRYVRHYDDLLLIDIRNGRVVRVYRNFYW